MLQLLKYPLGLAQYLLSTMKLQDHISKTCQLNFFTTVSGQCHCSPRFAKFKSENSANSLLHWLWELLINLIGPNLGYSPNTRAKEGEEGGKNQFKVINRLSSPEPLKQLWQATDKTGKDVDNHHKNNEWNIMRTKKGRKYLQQNKTGTKEDSQGQSRHSQGQSKGSQRKRA